MAAKVREAYGRCSEARTIDVLASPDGLLVVAGYAKSTSRFLMPVGCRVRNGAQKSEPGGPQREDWMHEQKTRHVQHMI
jgi:hypothetical protein